MVLIDPAFTFCLSAASLEKSLLLGLDNQPKRVDDDQWVVGKPEISFYTKEEILKTVLFLGRIGNATISIQRQTIMRML